MSKVYIVNNSGHDFSMAKKFGELVFLSEGKVNPYKMNNMYRQFAERMGDCTDDDYILVSGLSQMCMVAAGIQAMRTGVVNMLIYSNRDNCYVPRELKIDNLVDEI